MLSLGILKEVWDIDRNLFMTGQDGQITLVKLKVHVFFFNKTHSIWLKYIFKEYS